MKTKSFYDLLRTKLSEEKLEEIDRQARLEADILRSIQCILAKTMEEYMKKNKISFNEVVRRLSTSPNQAAKIRRGETNLTLASFARFLALIGKEPKDIFSQKNKIMQRTKSYEESLLKTLKDPEEALAYLNAALIDEDQEVFLLALKHVLKAQGIDISAFAEEANVTRQNVYRMLSKKGNPRWQNFRSMIDAMGLQFKLEVKHK